MAHALADTGVLGRPEEFFCEQDEPNWCRRAGLSPDAARLDYRRYLDAMIQLGTTDNGVFGCKLMWQFVPHFVRRLRSLPELAGATPPAALRRAMPDLHVVRIRRRDKVRAAISEWRAGATGIWAVPGDGTQWPQAFAAWSARPGFDPDLVSRLHARAHANEEACRQFASACRVRQMVVTYEDLVANWEDTLGHVAGVLVPQDGGDVPSIPPPRLRRQADEESERYIASWVRVTGGCHTCGHT